MSNRPTLFTALTLAALLGVVYVAMRLLTNPPPGLTTVFLLLLTNLGITSLGIGVLGEYIAKIYAESKRRPLWFVDYTLNLQNHAVAHPSDSAATDPRILPTLPAHLPIARRDSQAA